MEYILPGVITVLSYPQDNIERTNLSLRGLASHETGDKNNIVATAYKRRLAGPSQNTQAVCTAGNWQWLPMTNPVNIVE